MLLAAMAFLLLQTGTGALPCTACTPGGETIQRQVTKTSVPELGLPAARPRTAVDTPVAGQPVTGVVSATYTRQLAGSMGTGALPALASSGATAATISYPVVIAEPAKVQNTSHRFMDRTNLIGMSVHATVRVADATQTCILLGRPGRREIWLPMHSCGAIAAYSVSMVPAQVGSSYMLHRTGHHKLERWLPYMWAAPSAVGVGLSVRSW
jgi:hypothetical protein